ncbi:hypothetical protein [Microbulbifer sp. VAAF005]|uniref:hypothetical protein n=1 Tax=Microbulbifer sp. VAAF005 TaxID=3034230 RepID=UPI0024AD937F|nr:hypothetical protein [Microbulbifer sp. VAAF005]WHI45054.1 hypothetical protein P0078_15075 [Microbulbifer sp. VAAF005]
MSIKKYTQEEVKDLKDLTDYERQKRMTEEEIEKGAKTDPDALTPTEEDLKKFRKVKRK